MIRGTCLCGTVTYELLGEPLGMAHCHCSMCRKIHGTPFATYLSVNGLRWLSGEDHITSYESSPDFHRCFCDQCGSVLPESSGGSSATGNHDSNDHYYVPAGALTDPISIRPESHIFTSSAAGWYQFSDDLPRYDGYSTDDSSEVEQPSRAGAHADATGGSCLCGEVAYRYKGEPKFMMYCHCTRCRKVKSAAHASNVFVAPENFAWVKGEQNVVQYKLPEAERFGNSFCKTCGSSMPRVSPAIVVIPAGALDDDPGVEPRGHIYTASKAEWFDITDDYPQFEEGPPA